jgi:cyclophilin family peptidyl-prolyl cis-trans isomerase
MKLRALPYRAAGKMRRYLLARKWRTPPPHVIDPSRSYRAILRTSKGDLEAALFSDDAPIAVNNFVYLARAGYYDHTPFHRIVPGFVVQGGDPTGTGYGSPGYTFPDEPVTRDYLRGTLAMANEGPNTNGSQFFIVLANPAASLAKVFTIFGRVTHGLPVLDAIASVPTRPGPLGGEPSVPREPVTLLQVAIDEVPTTYTVE